MPKGTVIGVPTTVDAFTLAEFIGVNPTGMQNLIKDGILPQPVSRGRYDFVASVKAYCTYLKTQRNAGTKELAHQRARYMTIRADLADMLKDEKTGKLIRAEQLERALTECFYIVKTKLLTMPGKLAARISAVRDVNEIQHLLRLSVNEALEALNDFKLEGTQTTDLADIGELDNEGEQDDLDTSADPDNIRMGRSRKNAQLRGKRRAREMGHSAR